MIDDMIDEPDGAEQADQKEPSSSAGLPSAEERRDAEKNFCIIPPPAYRHNSLGTSRPAVFKKE